MDKQIRKPRIGDVAARAGVSTATVSRTLATPDQVKPETRDAVMRAVRETGYVLNLAARNLRTSRTHAVLAVLPDASNIFFSQVLRGISDTLHQHGYSLVIADTANLFVPFYTTKSDGSGIGLALSRQIAEAHGGALTLSNQVSGPGCEARLTLRVD